MLRAHNPATSGSNPLGPIRKLARDPFREVPGQGREGTIRSHPVQRPGPPASAHCETEACGQSFFTPLREGECRTGRGHGFEAAKEPDTMPSIGKGRWATA